MFPLPKKLGRSLRRCHGLRPRPRSARRSEGREEVKGIKEALTVLVERKAVFHYALFSILEIWTRSLPPPGGEVRGLDAVVEESA